ncbi:unnamed protein product [Amoebophrya sp. A25]|nr:unnamed protein product [Amoebophrya sp. A25]|eukprot:GSA25T00024381001.1
MATQVFSSRKESSPRARGSGSQRPVRFLSRRLPLEGGKQQQEEQEDVVVDGLNSIVESEDTLKQRRTQLRAWRTALRTKLWREQKQLQECLDSLEAEARAEKALERERALWRCQVEDERADLAEDYKALRKQARGHKAHRQRQMQELSARRKSLKRREEEVAEAVQQLVQCRREIARLRLEKADLSSLLEALSDLGFGTTLSVDTVDGVAFFLQQAARRRQVDREGQDKRDHVVLLT